MDIINHKLMQLQKLKNSKKYWNISWNQGIFISNFINLFQPKNILEIGTSNGFSTLFIAKNLNPNYKIYTIEVDKERFKESKVNFNSCKLTNIESIYGEAYDVLDNYNFLSSFDFIFIDALQREYLKLFKILFEKKLISNEFRIICDNVSSHSNMDEFEKYVSSNFNVEKIEIGSGFLLISNKN